MPVPIPGSASELTFGRVNKAFTNNLPGSVGNAPAGGQNIKLSAVLGTYITGTNTGTQISLSAAFGGKTGPYDY